MYSTCIFCSAGLGSNESVEAFPVGRSLAFDAWKGRLWAVCPRCSRWNLAPIEERWEATETAEKLFRDARLRAQSENVGLAKLGDGTRLIRIGEALPGELAAWRYGDQLARRRRRYLVAAGILGVAGVAYGGLAIAGALGGGAGAINIVNLAWQHRKARRYVHQLPAAESPTGESLLLRRYHLNGARAVAEEGGIALHLPHALGPTRVQGDDGRAVWLPTRSVVLTGPAARSVLGRAMVDANAGGGSRKHLGQALELLTGSGGAEGYLQRAAARDKSLGLPYAPTLNSGLSWKRFVGTFRGEAVPAGPPRPSGSYRRPWWSAQARADRLSRPEALALEMALHEETERRALEGELAALEAAWREAEEIAAIADALPHDPLKRIGGA
jgi:hypothetical protein